MAVTGRGPTRSRGWLSRSHGAHRSWWVVFILWGCWPRAILAQDSEPVPASEPSPASEPVPADEPASRGWSVPSVVPPVSQVSPDSSSTRPESGEAAEPEPCPEGSAVSTGASYILEAIEIRGNHRTRRHVIEREIALRPGQVLDLDDPGIEVSRYRLLSTGFFSDVQLRLRRGQRRGRVIVVVDVVERWTFVVRDIYLGVSDITPYGGLHLDERNLLGLGISLSGAFVAGREQQGYRLRLAYPRFLDSAFALSLELLYNDAQDYLGRRPVLVAGMGEAEQKYAVIDYQRFGGAVGAGVRLAHHTLLYVDYRLELVRAQLPLAAAQLDQPLGPNFGEPLDFYLADDRSILSALVFSLIRDTLNHPLLPSEGQRLALSTTLSSDVIGSHYHYMKLTVEGDFYVKMSWNHSFRFGFLVGAIFGEAPLFERYFVGDLSDQMHARVLQLNFSHAPPPNVFRNSTEEMRYESLAARLDVEYIAPLYRGRRVVYGVDFFLSFGIYSLGSAEDFASPPAGYKGGAFPVDLTMDLGFRLDTNAGVFGFSFKTLLGLIPFSEE